MDELVIGDKKYLSSKQAAKVTGYAKDYIGQLCREGRVPARLVGRSWYVLESAIHDHRFGEQKTDNEKRKEKEMEESSTAGLPEGSMFSPTWESPRYEAASTEEEPIPAVARAEKFEEPDPQRLQDSWKEWFDRIADASVATPAEVAEEEREEKKEEEEVSVPIRTIHQHPPEELLPRRPIRSDIRASDEEAYEEEEMEAVRIGVGRAGIAIRFAGMVMAVIFASLAVLGSGYLDKYIISSGQVGILAGVVLYNR